MPTAGAAGSSMRSASDSSFTPLPEAAAAFRPGSRPGSGASGGLRLRWKREDCEFVKHDKVFSDWKVLVGPSDWKEHASGKEGAQRFRARNLPASYSGPGVYELAVTAPAWLPMQRRSQSGFITPGDVVVVYVGHSDNIRQRLQRYGQAGAHLEGSRSTRMFVIRNDSASNSWKAELQGEADRTVIADDTIRAPSFEDRRLSFDYKPTGLDSRRMSTDSRRDSFDERRPSLDEWRPSTAVLMSPERGAGGRSPRGPRLFSETDSKAVAERVESELMEVFDYAWNRGGNIRQRSPDILAKIVMGGRSSNHGSRRKWIFFKKKRVGIWVAARKPPSEPGEKPNGGRGGSLLMLLPQLLTLGGKTSKNCEFTKLDIPVDRCGVLLETGLPCNALPVKGLKRCLVHKDMKKRNQRKPIRVAHTSQSTPVHEANSDLPCDIPRTMPPPPPPPGALAACFPFLAPVAPVQPSVTPQEESKRGRGTLSFNSWLRTSEIRMARSMEWGAVTEDMMNGGDLGINIGPKISTDGPPSMRSARFTSNLSTWKEAQNEILPPRRDICGLRLDDGTVCTLPPRPDRKRCFTHRGLRNSGLRSPNNIPSSLQISH